MNINIRLAAETDLKTVVQLSLKLVRQHQSYNNLRFVGFENHEKRLLELFTREIKSTEAIVLVAEQDEQIVGYAYLSVAAANLVEISQRVAWLDDIYVDEAARGHQVGKLLLEAAKDAAREKLGTKVLMLHVAPQNETARAIFESNGFQTTMTEMMLNLSSNE